MEYASFLMMRSLFPHAFIYLFIHPFIHSFTSFNHSYIHPLIGCFVCSWLGHSLVTPLYFRWLFSPLTLGPAAGRCVPQVDLEQELLLSLSVEGCRPDRPLDISAARAAGLDWAPVALRDARGRLLLLRARLRHGAAGWLRLTVSAPYWLVNRTGLPLLVAQEQTEQLEAAGQEADHERARSVAPLMFSLSDPEAPHMMVARLGRGHHPDGTPRVSKRPRQILLEGESRGGGTLRAERF